MRHTVASLTLTALLMSSAPPVLEAVGSDAAYPVATTVPPGPRTASVGRASRSGANRVLGRLLARERGWTGREWVCLDVLWGRESHWDDRAANKRSSAYGIPQNITGGSARYRLFPSEQIRWGLDYIRARYGTPCRALAHSNMRGWY